MSTMLFLLQTYSFHMVSVEIFPFAVIFDWSFLQPLLLLHFLDLKSQFFKLFPQLIMAENVDPIANNVIINNATLTNLLNPYYAHPNENPGVAIVAQVLNGGNYHSWSRDMLLALKTKKKVKFVYGSLLALNDPNFTL